MIRDTSDQDFDEPDPLDRAIRAAFAPDDRPERAAFGHRSDLDAAAEEKDAPRVVLRETEHDSGPVLRQRTRGADEYPAQIDRYHVIGEIARGGVGVILKARDLDLGREVALKLLLDRHRGNAELGRRFLEEAQIGGQLQHPGIVPVFEMGSCEVDRPYLAMKLVRGNTLAELLERRADRTEDRLRFLKVFEQVCQTLAYAHSKGVIHRDLKPSNVMVGPFGEVQVMDWGLSKVLPADRAAAELRTTRPLSSEPSISTDRTAGAGSRSVAGSVMGTPAYMPPEQARGTVDTLDERSDVFGLGAILCEILTGKPPYTGETVDEVYQKARQADLGNAFERLGASGADGELLEIARSCLHAKTQDRPRNAIVVGKRMQKYLESLVDRAHELEVRTSKARLKLTVAVLVIIGLVLGGAGYLWLEGKRKITLAAVERAVIEAQRLRAEAMARDDLATWEAALHEANRGLELAAGGVDPAVKEHATALRDGLAVEVKDQRVLAQLERLRQDRGVYSEELFLSFRNALSSYGLELEAARVDDVAQTIRESSIGPSLVLALDQWIPLLRGPLRARLYEIAQRADTDPWRRRVRAAVMDDDEVELSRLAAEASAREPDPSTFDLLAGALSPRWHRAASPGRSSEQAESLLRVAQRVHPGDFWINVRLGVFLWQVDKLDEAIQYLRIAVALRPKSAHGRYKLGAALGEHREVAEAADELRRSILLDPELPFAYGALTGVLRDGDTELTRVVIEDVLRSLRGIRSSGRPYRDEGLTQLLARAQAALGDTRSAILTLEELERRHGAPFAAGKRFPGQASPADDLIEYRRRLLPDLASFASIDAALDGSLSGEVVEGEPEPVEMFRGRQTSTDGVARSRLAYLDGRLLQSAGRREEAVARFRQAIDAGAALPEPFLRLAECLREIGAPSEAEAVLRRALKEESNRCPAVLRLWLLTSFADLGRPGRDVFRLLPAGADAPTPEAGRFDEDVRWLLARLSSNEPLRINCGGGAHDAPDGLVWGRDCFFSQGSRSYSGRAYVGEIAATEHDLLYQTNRWFPRQADERNGYSIPVPRGSYEVVLHFAEVWYGALDPDQPARSFDIVVEGEVAREAYEPMRDGFATAARLTVRARVDDGVLDIDFRHRRDNPTISAIAVSARDE